MPWVPDEAADAVVFWIRYLSHPTYFGVRQRVRALRTPHCYWSRTSPGSLAALVARASLVYREGAADSRVKP